MTLWRTAEGSEMNIQPRIAAMWWFRCRKTLIVPFLAFNLLFIILWPLCWKIGIWGTLYKLEGGEGIFSIYMYYFKQFFIDLFNDQALPDIPTWFLLTLFWCKILTDCICCHRWTIVVLLCIMAGTLFIVFHYRTCLRIGNALMVMPFFYGGFLYKKVINEWRNVRYGWLWGIILVALNIPLTLLNGRVSTAVIWFGQMTIPLNIIIFYLNAFMSSVGLLFVCMQFPASKTLTVCAKALITILCFQCFFCCVFCHLCDLSNYLKMSLIAVLILLACVLIHKTLERYLPFTVGKQEETFK